MPNDNNKSSQAGKIGWHHKDDRKNSTLDNQRVTI
jgi:hypothetical protein